MPTTVDFNIEMLPLPAILVSDFNEAANEIRSFREPIKRAIQGIIAPSLVQHFIEEGPGWAPLAESTIRKKGHDRILFETGTLMRISGQLNAWTINGGYLSEDSTAMASLDNLGDADYGVYHQTGTIKMVARPWADIDEQTEDEISEVFAAYIAERMGRTMLRAI